MARRSQQRSTRTAKTQGHPSNQEAKEEVVEVAEVSQWRVALRSVIFFITGGVFCFYGQSAFTTITFFSGFTVIGAFARIACFKLLGSPRTATQATNHNSIAILIGLFGGQFVGFSERLSFGCIGVLGGFLFGLYLLCVTRYTTLIPANSRLALIFSFVMTGILTTSQLETTYVAFSTAFAGAFIMVYGMDVFLRTGIDQFIAECLVGSVIDPNDDGHKLWYHVLLFLVIPTFWLGCLSQLEQ